MAFTKKLYYREKFVKTVLTEERIQARVFEECEFNNCSFTGCKFESCKFLNCKFNECDLSSVIPMGCHFTDVRFLRCKAIGIDWTKAQKMRDISFIECLINYSNFTLLKLPKLKMIKCEAKEVTFIETDLSDGDFKSTDFEKSTFFKTDLTNADFGKAINYFIDIKTNTLKKTHFSLPEAMSLLNALDIIID